MTAKSRILSRCKGGRKNKKDPDKIDNVKANPQKTVFAPVEQKLMWKTTAQVIMSSIPGPMKECHTGNVVLALMCLQQLSHQMQEVKHANSFTAQYCGQWHALTLCLIKPLWF